MLPIQEALWLKHPILAKYDTLLATGLSGPGWVGQLPTGEMGVAGEPVVHFIMSSMTHPRPVQRQYNVPHVSMATGWKRGWDEAIAETRHHVQGEQPGPAEKIFRALAVKHVKDLINFEQMV